MKDRITYSERLKDPRWQRKRLEILQRDDFTCRLCHAIDKTLHVHHLWYARDSEPWDYPGSCLLTVCHECHDELHVGRFGEFMLEALVVGRADLIALHDLLSTFQCAFMEGPDANPVPAERWGDIATAIGAAIDAVQRGASGREVYEAVSGLARPKDA